VPGDVVYALNLARSLLREGKLREAGDEARRAFEMDRANALACGFWAHCLEGQGRHAEVVQALQSLDPATPRDVDHHQALGRALQALRRPREAIAAYFDALALKMDIANVHYQVGVCFNDLDMKEEASECFKTALVLDIGLHELGVRGLLAFFEREVCRWDDAEADLSHLVEAVRALPDDAAAPTTPFAQVTLLDDPRDQLRAAKVAARHLSRGIVPLPALAPRNAAERAGRIRVGYLSADFHQHATCILMAELLERHDRARFEVTLYSHGKDDGTDMRRRIERACEHFVDLRGQTDLQIAERIRADGIDLLIDLKGYTRDNRLPVLAYRPARVQAAYLGFPGTTGAGFIDYLIGDAVVTPLEHADRYSEKLVQLPRCYQPNDRQRARPAPTPRAALGLPEHALVLCGFNQPFKISKDVFDVWCRLLQAVPGSVLWLLEWNGQVRRNLAREAQARGIDPQRLVWAPRVKPADHIARLQQADLFVDTWPCNAHTTASDALWAGVPVVTFLGETFASRVAGSLVRSVGLPELVCEDVAAYEGKALALMHDAGARAALRARLVAARETSPLFDSARIARDLEAVFTRLVARHDAGLPPDHLAALEAVGAVDE
jgi:predicted O-linked N-acetylglucosamine transferase (SPINDLY family)